MLIISGIGMAIGHFTLGIYNLLIVSGTTDDIRWLAIIAIVTILASFGLGWGPVVFLSMSELLPLRIRAFGSGAAMIANWLTGFLITYFYKDMTKVIEIYGTFWFYAVFSIVAVIYVYYLVPETTGKSLEEIEAYFRRTEQKNYDDERMELMSSIDK